MRSLSQSLMDAMEHSDMTLDQLVRRMMAYHPNAVHACVTALRQAGSIVERDGKVCRADRTPRDKASQPYVMGWRWLNVRTR